MPILSQQLLQLFILAIPVACISWTVTNEEVFKELREFCINRSKQNKSLVSRKFFYLFTCEFCFSHYITIIILLITKFHLIYAGWRGYLIAGFSLVWIANIYMGLFRKIRLEIKNQKTDVELKEEELQEKKEQ